MNSYLNVMVLSKSLKRFEVHSVDVVKNIKSNSSLGFMDYTGIPVQLPIIEATVHNICDDVLYGKKVVLSLVGYEDASDKLSGVLSHKSSETGTVKFENIIAHKVGEYKLVLKCENVELKLRSFYIAPPGIDVDFENKEYGSPKYWEAFMRSIRISKNNKDTVTIKIEDELCQI